MKQLSSWIKLGAVGVWAAMAMLAPSLAQALQVPVATGIETCPTAAPGNCNFMYFGERAAGIGSGTVAGPTTLLKPFSLSGYTLPLLVAARPTNDVWSSLFTTSSSSQDPENDWTDPLFIFEGFIGRDGVLRATPDIDGNTVSWQGFAWRWSSTCQPFMPGDTACGYLGVTSTIQFQGVRLVEGATVPEPAAAALTGVALLGAFWMRRRR